MYKENDLSWIYPIDSVTFERNILNLNDIKVISFVICYVTLTVALNPSM